MTNNFHYKILPVTQRFVLADDTVAELKSLKPNFGYNGLGEFVFRRTYSRDNEDWADVVIRVMQGVFSIRKEHFYRNGLEWNDSKIQKYAHDMALSMFNMKWLPAGRGLWMCGSEFVYQRGSMALFNCGAFDTEKDIVHAAEWSMDALMNGTGIGFSTYWKGTAIRPDKSDTETFVISDSREGWVESLIKLLCSYIDSPRYGKCKFPVFDYSLVRPSGLPIRGFGGISSGPEPLIKLHKRVESYLDNLCQGYIEVEKVTKKRKRCDNCGTDDEEGVQLTEKFRKPYGHTRFTADLFNAIGCCVVAGNVRRSALLCLGRPNDQEFMDLKNYEKNPERQEISWSSNNSVALSAEKDFADFFCIPDIAKRISRNGEPGCLNLYNMQKFGRYGKEAPDNASLVNPCAEICLESAELCNLSEVFPPRCENPEEFYQALKYATFYTTTVSLLPTHRPETNAVIAKNRRIGVSISGFAQLLDSVVPPAWGSVTNTDVIKFLRNGYKIVREENIRLSDEAGVPRAIRLTTVKPSGSISLLTGCSPGAHFPVSRYAIRRVRVAMNSPLVESLIKSKIPYEKDVYSDGSWVFSFPIDHGPVRSAEQVTPFEQFNNVAMLQKHYSDNSVSVTIYFDKEKEDSKEIEKLLSYYVPILKSVSMLPHSGHLYEQAPYEPITKEKYEELLVGYKMPDFSMVKDNEPIGEKYCDGDKCELK